MKQQSTDQIQKDIPAPLISKQELLKYIDDAASQYGNYNITGNDMIKSTDLYLRNKRSYQDLKYTLSKNNLNGKALESLKLLSPNNDYVQSMHSGLKSNRSLAPSHFSSAQRVPQFSQSAKKDLRANMLNPIEEATESEIGEGT